jgi:predicted PurR-regulated permease PerM
MAAIATLFPPRRAGYHSRMNTSPDAPAAANSEIATLVVAVIVLCAILKLHLLSAIFSCMLVHELVTSLAPRLGLGRLSADRARIVAVAILSTLVVSLLILAVVALTAAFRHGGDSFPALLQKLAEVLENSRDQIPAWLGNYIPADASDLRQAMVVWLKENSSALPGAGRIVGQVTAHILIGMVIGAMLALHQAVPLQAHRPLARIITRHAQRMSLSFRRVVFAQAWIAGINTVFTAFFLMVILPMAGIHLPLVKTMVALTFVAGLMPIIGNLVSNTAIVLVSFSYSFPVALASLAFLISIHKLEYFLNARIIGSHIRARAWELLAAMLVMEAAFGLIGLIAAPIYYAYLKDELTELQLV